MANKLVNKNLSAIQRIDPFAEAIISQTTHVALFDFIPNENKWQKTEIEGPLFVYRRFDLPLYSFMIASRQSLTEFVEPVNKEITLKYEPPYIFLYKTDGSIKGVWVFGEDECKRLYNTLTLLLQSMDDPSKAEHLGAITPVSVSTPPLFNDEKETNIISLTPSSSITDTPKSDTIEKRSRRRAVNVSQKYLNKPEKSSDDSASFDMPPIEVKAVKVISAKDLIESAKSAEHSKSESPKSTKNVAMPTLTKSTSIVKEPVRAAKRTADTQVYDNGPVLGIYEVNDKMNTLSLKNNQVVRTESASVATISMTEQNLSGLSKDQLAQALAYLLKNDASFLDKIHQAYADSLKGRFEK